MIGYKNKSARTTPEPKLSYIQLDLNSNAKSKEPKSQTKLPNETARKELTNGLVNQKSVSNGETSKVKNVPTCTEAAEDDTKDSQDSAKASTTVPYAQIDFAKTLALSNSAANHRKL